MMKRIIVCILVGLLIPILCLGCGEDVDYRKWTESEKATSVPLYITERSSRIVKLNDGVPYRIEECFNFDETINTPVEAEKLANEAWEKMIVLSDGYYQDDILLNIEYYTGDNTWVFAFGPPGIWCGSPEFVAVAGEDGSFMNFWHNE